MRRAHKVLVENPEGKITAGEPRHTWHDNIETGFKKSGLGSFRMVRLELNCVVL
jgi:hypothetical protein